jgi:hypothetical protein
MLSFAFESLPGKMHMTTFASSSKRRFIVTAGLLAAGAALSLTACGSSDDSLDTLSASLSGDQEAPQRVVSGATGTGSFTLNRSSRTLSGSVALDGVTPSLVHIHAGAADTAGAVLFPLTIVSPQLATLAPTVLTPLQVTALDAGELYVNVHSGLHPDGEIRGQLGREVFTSQLNGLQETTPVVTAGAGKGTLVLDPATRTITGGVTLTGFTATVAQVQAGAFGSNGAIRVALVNLGGGIFAIPAPTVLTPVEVATLRAGGFYFNAGSGANPNGEVRGQIGQRVLLATATGAQEVPPNASTATGRGVLTYDQRTRALQGNLTLTGMTATMAHIHLGAAGNNGPIVVTLAETFNGSGVWAVPANTTLTAEQGTALLGLGMYYNAHSGAFAGGEVRGQLLVQ